jgi:hypothetical protein
MKNFNSVDPYPTPIWWLPPMILHLFIVFSSR